LCRAFNFDDDRGYHNVVRGNICYDNELKVMTQASSGGNGRTLTDGNGIIIDVFQHSRKNPLIPHGQDKNGPLEPYRGRTLVENNLIFDNGGRGIHVFRSSKVDVVNNTTYLNQKSPDINGGELTAIESSEVVLANNIAYGQKEKRINNQDGSSRVIWVNNLFANADDVLIHDGLIQDDPQFVAPTLNVKPEGFRLKATSPARGKALKSVAPLVDVLGKPRPAIGALNLGAF
jgi:parallel beta-helix repeat protein